MAQKSDLSHSFVDLMTSLAIIFILLMVATLNNAASTGEQAIKDLKQEVVEELKAMGLTLDDDPDDPNTQIIRLDEEKVKFDYKKAELKKEGKDLIGRLFIQLTPKLCEPKLLNKIESVIVEGHTDSLGNQTTVGKLDNVKLSQDRAFAVMKEAFLALDARGMRSEEECLRHMVSAIGRGSSRPVAHKPDAASRRVEIKIRVKVIIPRAG